MTDDRADRSRDDGALTSTEAVALALLVSVASLVVVPFLLDAVGLPFPPAPIFALAVLAFGASLTAARRVARRGGHDSAAWGLVVGAMFAWLLWLARPDLLPLGSGPDLTHHLILVHYLEAHWRLVHDPGVERFLGEMAQYTPGSQLLAAFAGAWSGTDGLRALHATLAATVALKAGFLWLIARRALPATPGALPLALVAVLLLPGAPRYFLGSFTEYSFVAQVVAELFVVAMWWTLVAWADRPSQGLCFAFSGAGAAAFLTWPVYVGPPVLAALLVLAGRPGVPLPTRVRHGAAAFGLLGGVAVLYLAGRLAWLQMAGTGGEAPWPTVAAYTWLLLAAALAGAVRALRRRGGALVTLAFLSAVLLQTGALLVLAQRSGASQPYMALKMFYLVLWPLCLLATFAVSWLWEQACGPATARRRWSAAAAWACVCVVAVLVARPLLRAPERLHPRRPAVSLPLYEAGRWARAHVPAHCVEYLVGDPDTAYWLHLAVLGNPRMSQRTGDDSTYELSASIVRWLTPGGRPYAIVDLAAVPRDVREELQVVATFTSAAVARRRGAASCEPQP